MAAFTIEMPRRHAVATINSYLAKRMNVEPGEHDCYVLGLFQECDDEGAGPVFVCEMDSDGRVFNIHTEFIRFVDIAFEEGRRCRPSLT